MIEANKKYISATLRQGTAHIQGSLIQLYSYNLNAIGTQAALIAGFAFTALSDLTPTDATTALQYFYYICYTICLITALFVLTQATIAAIYGSTLSVRGKEAETVEYAAGIMKERQEFILKMGFTCISALFVGGVLQSWSMYPTGIAVITTFLYITFWCWLVFEGFETFRVCQPNMETSIENADDAIENKEKLQVKIKEKTLNGSVKFISPTNISGMKYVVLDTGKLFIYKDERSYKFQENCIAKAINLRAYKVRDDRRISSTGTSIILVPIVETEIEINAVYEFTTQDGAKWKETIKEVCNAFDDLSKYELSVDDAKYQVTQVVRQAMAVKSSKNDTD